MFAIDCLKANGTHLGTCIDKFYFGSCCQLQVPEEAIYQQEIVDNSIDNNVVSNFQHYSSPQLVPVSTIAAPVHQRRNITASVQRVTLPTTTKKKHTQNDVRVTTENIRLSTFQLVQEARVTTPTPTKIHTKPTKGATKAPVKVTNTTTIKTTSKTKPTQTPTHKPTSTTLSVKTTPKKNINSKITITTTVAPTTSQRKNITTVNSSLHDKWSTTRRTPTPVIKIETSTFAPLNQQTTTTKTTPKRTTTQKVTVHKRPSIITGSTSHPITMPYRNLTNRNPTKPTSPTNKTSGAYMDAKPIYINVTQTKAPRPKPKPTSEITIVPATSLSYITQETEFTTMQYVSSSRVTTTQRPLTTTLSELIRNSTSYVTNTSFKPTQRPMSSTTERTVTQVSESTSGVKTSSVKPTLSTSKIPSSTKTTTKHSALDISNSTKSTQPPPTKITTSTKIPPKNDIKSTLQTTTRISVRPTQSTKEQQTTQSIDSKRNITTAKTTTPKPLYSTVSSTQFTSSFKPSTHSTEKPILVTWMVPLVNASKNETTESEMQPVNWVLLSSTPAANKSTSSPQTSTSKKPIQAILSTQSTTTTAPRTTEKSTKKTTTTTTSRRPTTRSTTTMKPITKAPTTVSTTTKKPLPIIDDTGIPVLLIPENSDSSTTNPLSYSTEEIIGTSTSTSIEIKPPQSTQSSFVTSNVQNVSISTQSSTLEYNATDSPSSLFGSNSTDNFFSSTTPVMPQLEGVDYRQICGKRMFPEPRIVGGAKASFGRWPWQISLRQWRTSTYLHKCGAALLNENWAITAAHCVDNVPPSDLLLRLGEYDLAVEEEPYGYQERRVQIVASHPQFDPRTFEYDLALLRFYEPVIFQPNIIPVCVPDSDENFIGRTAYVTGWGRLYEDGPLPSVLQEVTVPVIKNDICEGMYRAAGYIEHIPHIFICAGWKKGGYDSCEGDSGGPMVIQRHDKRFLLAGVISWGIGCAEPNQPGVYTRISEFRDWINQILQF
ncbi:serine proteinase stubble [Culicoides brevitarsis]|uniref:serine proteinase stubble n=1 Tax=Culicoides brevitarsis TaxID=469753 RepID=UPI00307C05C8